MLIPNQDMSSPHKSLWYVLILIHLEIKYKLLKSVKLMEVLYLVKMIQNVFGIVLTLSTGRIKQMKYAKITRKIIGARINK